MARLLGPALLWAMMAAPTGYAGEDPTSLLVKGSAWKGVVAQTKPQSSSATFRIVITERTGDSFKADLYWLENSRTTPFRRIQGEATRGGHFSWKGAAGESRPGLLHVGKISKDRIEVAIAPNDKKVAATVVLNLDRGEGVLPTVASYGDFPDLTALVRPVEISPQNPLWQELADLLSFSYLRGTDRWQMPITDRLYLPFRGKRLAEPEKQGFHAAENALLYRLDQMVAVAPPADRPMALQAQRLVEARLKIARVNQVAGNTPDSSFRIGAQFVIEALSKWDELEKQVQKDIKKKTLSALTLVTFLEAKEAGSSDALRALIEKRKQVGGLPAPALLSGYFSYGDMAVVECLAEFWRQNLVPLAKKGAGPASAQPLVEVTPGWRKKKGDKGFFERFDHFQVRNISGKKLTNVVVEIEAETEWHDKAAHYYFFRELAAGEVHRCLPQQRWELRRLDFVTQITSRCSAWADQGSSTNSAAKFISPTPHPDPADWREKYLEQDRLHLVEGEAWSILAVIGYPLPRPTTRPNLK